MQFDIAKFQIVKTIKIL